MKFKKIVKETSALDDRDYETSQSMQDFAKTNIPEVKAVVSGSGSGKIYVMLKSDVYIMADQAKEIAKELIQGSGARDYRYAGFNKEDPYIVLVNKGVRMYEAKRPMKKAQKKEQWWFDIPGAKYIYHGDWSDPEIQYKGFSINYWDVEEGLLSAYRDEHPEDKDDKGFDAWMAEQGGQGGYLQGELDNLVYAALGDDGLEDEEWLGIPDAYKVKEVYGQGDGDFVLYKDCLVDISQFEYYDKDYDDYFTYEDDPQGFEAYYIDKANRGELIDQLNREIRGLVPDATLMEEGFKDAMKSGWEKVKTGAKKVGKAIGDVFKGPFRKGDQIVMKGEDGEEFKGTIKNFSLGDKTYEVLLGNSVNEGLQEDVLDMADREDELVWIIQDQIDDLRREDPELIRDFALNCVELEKIKPGRLEEILP